VVLIIPISRKKKEDEDLWRNGYERVRSHPNHEMRLSAIDPRCKASPGHGWEEFFEFSVTDPPLSGYQSIRNSAEPEEA